VNVYRLLEALKFYFQLCIYNTTKTTFKILESIRSGNVVSVDSQ